MHYTTTLSQKGQIVVPKHIRDQLRLQTSDVLQISLKENVIIAKPIAATDDVFGMFQAKKPISQKDIKQSVEKHVRNKFNVYDRT